MSPNVNGVAVDQELRMEIATDMNVSVLRRMDRNFLHVVQTASHAAVYKLRGKQWERCDVDGATFIYERTPPDGTPNASKYRILCINRRSPENFRHDVQRCSRADIEVVNNNMITFPAKNGDIYGMWFYVSDELRPFHDTLCAIAEGQAVPPLSHPRSSASGSAIASSKSTTTQVRASKKESPRRKARVPPNNTSSKVATGSTTNGSQAQSVVENQKDNRTPAVDNSLRRFFPNLQAPANGVIGSVIPTTAHDVAVAGNGVGTTQTKGLPNGQVERSFLDTRNPVQVSAPNIPHVMNSSNISAPSQFSLGNQRADSDDTRKVFMQLFHRGAPHGSSPLAQHTPSYPNALAPTTSSLPIPSRLTQIPNTMGQIPPPVMSPPVGAQFSGMQHMPPNVPQISNGVHTVPMMMPGVPGLHPTHYQAAHAQQQQAQMALLAHQHAQQQQRHSLPQLHHPQLMFPNQLQDIRSMPASVSNGFQSHGIPVSAATNAQVGVGPANVPSNYEISSPNGRLSNVDGQARDVLLGMLKPGAVHNSGVRKEDNSKTSLAESVQNVGSSIANLELTGTGSEIMSKSEFRAVVSRMLSDRKLFDSAYKAYNTECERVKKMSKLSQ